MKKFAELTKKLTERKQKANTKPNSVIMKRPNTLPSATKTATDTERLDWLEKEGIGAGLINDDNGHWAVAFDGFQNITAGEGPIDTQTTFFIEKKDWKDTAREAIDSRMEEFEE